MAATEKQVELAKKLAEEQKLELDDKIFEDFDKTSKFIEEAISNAPRSIKPPSDKQISFAEKLSKEKTKDLPNNYKEDWKVCSNFIDECLGK